MRIEAKAADDLSAAAALTGTSSEAAAAIVSLTMIKMSDGWVIGNWDVKTTALTWQIGGRHGTEPMAVPADSGDAVDAAEAIDAATRIAL